MLPGPAGALDVQYPATGGAAAAVVVAEDVLFLHMVAERVAMVAEVAEYRPGHFAERELPALLAVLDGTVPAPALLVVDGYVDLDPDGRPGLGAHLARATGCPVIGVAKTRFRTATHAVEVRRGTASRPVHVTATGIPLLRAADAVARMAGRHRVPDALTRADRLARAATRRP